MTFPSDPLAAKTAPKRGVAVPFVIEQKFGSRPIVNGRVTGVPYRFMVHANAGAPVQMNHRWAKAAKVGNLKHKDAYGIVAAGKISPLGRDEGILPVLTVGTRRYFNARTSIFETPNLGNVGMLGTGWIHDADVVMDFPEKLLFLDSSPHQVAARNRALRARGYITIPMRFDVKSKRYLVDAVIGEAKRAMVVSTVAGLIIDEAFAAEAGVDRGTMAGELEGPKGAVLHSFHTRRPVTIRLGAWSSVPLAGQVEDIYAYANSPRPPSDASGGMLGADFLIKHDAVIDFARERLYLKK